MEASHPEQGTLQAWIEGQLDSAEHERIEAHLAECAQCREAVAEARGLIAGASRIVSALDGAPAGVVPIRSRRPRFAPARWAAAAAVLLFAATSVVVSREFRSGGIDLPSAAIDATARSDESVVAAPALAPAAVPQQAPPAVTNVGAARRSAAAPTREQIATAPGAQARSRSVRDGAASDVQERREFSQRLGAVESQEGVTAETDLTGRIARDRAAGQIANAAPTLSVPAPAPAPPPPPAAPVPTEPRPSSGRLQLDAVVTSGSAAEPAGSSSARTVRVVRYEARPGVIVVLTEYEEPPRAGGPTISVRGQARAQVSAARPDVAEMSAVAPAAGESAFMWRHPEGGRFYVLRGPVPRPELVSLARRLSELKVVR